MSFRWLLFQLGDGNEEYLERENLDTIHLNLFDDEIRDRNEHLVHVDRNIEQYKFLKLALLRAFAEIDLNSAKSISGR
jgi:hypothetical protein